MSAGSVVETAQRVFGRVDTTVEPWSRGFLLSAEEKEEAPERVDDCQSAVVVGVCRVPTEARYAGREKMLNRSDRVCDVENPVGIEVAASEDAGLSCETSAETRQN